MSTALRSVSGEVVSSLKKGPVRAGLDEPAAAGREPDALEELTEAQIPSFISIRPCSVFELPRASRDWPCVNCHHSLAVAVGTVPRVYETEVIEPRCVVSGI